MFKKYFSIFLVLLVLTGLGFWFWNSKNNFKTNDFLQCYVKNGHQVNFYLVEFPEKKKEGVKGYEVNGDQKYYFYGQKEGDLLVVYGNSDKKNLNQNFYQRIYKIEKGKLYLPLNLKENYQMKIFNGRKLYEVDNPKKIKFDKAKFLNRVECKKELDI